MNKEFRRKIKIGLIVILVVLVSLLHYLTGENQHYYHIFFIELYFLPVVLAAFWFGLRGALSTSLAITACFAPFIWGHWQNFSPYDFGRILSVVLFNSSAVFIGALRDREKSANKRLMQAESLAAIGKSLAAVAHDMKTPLVAIGGFTRQVLKKIEKNDPAHDKLTLVLKETVRMESMIKNMLDFSRPLEVQLFHGGLNEIVEDSIAIVDETARKKAVTVECILSRDLPPVAFDAFRMKQVIVNLAMNAVEASPEGEKVIIRTSNATHELIIDVVDCGSGISLDHGTEVFDPFFTTKKEGTGLGLPIVQKIMEAHGGSLEVLDNSPIGTIFRVILPKR